MAKVKFEVDIAFEVYDYPQSTDKKYLKEEMLNKAFLYKDPMGCCQVFWVRETNKGESGEYALFGSMPLPIGAKYELVEREEECIGKEELFSHIQDCCDKTCNAIKHYYESLNEKADNMRQQEMGNGISEKTLLEALKIVSGNKNKEE